MSLFAEFAAAAFGLLAAASWGAGDFTGAVASRRASLFSLLLFMRVVEFGILVALALAASEPLPPLSALAWGGAAGFCGGLALAALYRALSMAPMGLSAPLSAVIAASLPVLFAALTEGLPSTYRLAGFALALVGVWLIARPSNGGHSNQGLTFAVIAGVGFGLFYIFLRQAGTAAVFWPLAAALLVSLLQTVVILLVWRKLWQRPSAPAMRLAVLAAALDVGGNVFYVLASREGRLDVAVILSSLYPAFTVLLAFIILREHLSRVQWLGVFAVLTAIPLVAAG
ncbi:MAG: DMT family transporter [Anaerolineae bacterium]